jgi:hypothetical protein
LAITAERGELEQRFLDQPMDERALCQASVLFLAHRGLHDRRDVVCAHRLREAEHEARQILPELTCARVTFVAVPGERSVDDGLELGRDAAVDLRDRRYLRGLDLMEDLDLGVAREQALRSEQLPQDDPDGKDVGAAVDVFPQCRLGRQVGELSLDDARFAPLELGAGLGQSEVDDLHFAVLRDEHVGWGHVAMHQVERHAAPIG